MRKFLLLCLLYILGSAAWAGIPGAVYMPTAGVNTVGALPYNSNYISPITITAETTSFAAAIGTNYTINNPTGTVTVTLPDASTSGYKGQTIGVFFQSNTHAQDVEFATASSQTIGQYTASTWQLIYAGTNLLVVSDGSNWQVAASNQFINLNNSYTNSSSNTVGGVFGTLGVGSGGTGATSFTQYGVLLGAGTSSIGVTAAGTANYPLVANSAANPTFQQLSLTAGVTGVLPIANGGTDNGSLAVTAGGMTYTDGTKLVNTGAGTSGYPMVSAGASAPGFALLTGSGIASSVALAGSPTTTTQSSSDNSTKIATTAYVQSVLPAPAYGFGGNGADGAISNPTSASAPFQQNSTTWSLTGANTYTLGTANTANTGAPIIINATSTFTLGDASNASTITIAAGSGASGGASVTGNTTNLSMGYPGAGPGGGVQGFTSVYPGGGGGGFGGGGGKSGGGAGGNGIGTAGGQTYPGIQFGGSGGASGMTFDASTSDVSGAGGNGGGSLIVCAVGVINCKSVSVINCKGGNATNASVSAGGSGGGSGGLVLLASQASVTVAGTINVSGGTGSNGAGSDAYGGGGGGGGSGRIICWAPTVTTTGATFTMSGGSGGTGGGSSGNGGSGSSGSEQSITGTPNLPLICWLNTPEGQNSFNILDILCHHHINQKSLAWMAGKNTLNGMCYYNMGNYQESTCIGIGDYIINTLS